MSIRILIGDVRDRLRDLADESIHCCVTSPPYFGLRDYGVAGQIGLEPTPDEYVAAIVGVFRDVRRVLRKDGTLWLNLGSSYASGDTRPIRSRGDVPAYDSDGKALPNLNDVDRACPDCGGELIACFGTHHRRNAHTVRPSGQHERPRAKKGHDNGHQDSASVSLGAFAPDVPQSTNSALRENGQDAYGPANDASVCQSEHRTFFDGGQQSDHNLVCTNDIAQSDRPSNGRTSDKVFVCMACGYSTRMYPQFKSKDMIPIPWLVALALQTDGWYLRQDIIWHKPNPMPESVTDRCTKAHEYVFLLSKSERYFYDAYAIAEDSVRAGDIPGGGGAWRNTADPRVAFVRPENSAKPVADTRNRRSVWTITTQPFSEAHFATFPPELAELCIKAGCPEAGTVLDPFGGAGTTGLVADRLGRKAILIELNPTYAELSERRIVDDAPLFARVEMEPMP